MRELGGRAGEIKFLVDAFTGRAIRDWVRVRLAPDAHGGGPAGDRYDIASLYFDTGALDVFHRRGSNGRCKYRVRRYDAGDVVFLERKLRTARTVNKRRTSVRLGDLAWINGAEPPAGWAGRWFRRRLKARALLPQCLVAYRRTARVGVTPHGTHRVTLDEDVRALGPRDLNDLPPASPGQPGPWDIGTVAVVGGVEFSPVFSQNVVVELKCTGPMPAVFKALVAEFALVPRRMSKYRQAMVAVSPEAGVRIDGDA